MNADRRGMDDAGSLPEGGLASSSAPAPWIEVAVGSARAPVPDIPRPRRILAQLAAMAALVFVAVSAGATIAAIRLAEREAVNDAATLTNLLAQSVIQPVLDDGLLTGDPAALRALDQAVRASVLPQGIVRVKLWTPEGRVLYADESRLIGQTFPLGPDQREVLAAPATRAEVSDLGRSENEFERVEGRLVEVYRPVWTPRGAELLFEVYGDYEPVRARSNDLWRGIAGVLATSLILLLVLMAPVIWRLLGRLRGAHEAREELLRRAVDASDVERRRIAANLHDGPVQDLAASAFAVAGAAEQMEATGARAAAAQARAAAATVRASIASLRTLLVDLYPATLTETGLAAALNDLAKPLRARGVAVALDVADAHELALTETQVRLIHRVAHECLRNVAKHAGACAVTVTLSRDEAHPERPVRLEVADDGVGFDALARLRDPEPGHVGLRVLADLAREAGADLSVASAPQRGARWRLVLTPGGEQ